MVMAGMERRRIAVFLPSLVGGGAERVMVTLVNAFVRRRFAVDLVLASLEGPYLTSVGSGVRVVDLKAGRVIKALFPLIRYLRRERPVAMLSAMGHANVVAVMAAKLSRTSTRVVVSERTTVSGAYQNATGLSAKLTFRLMRSLYPNADGICSVSKAVALDLAEFVNLPSDKVEVIYNPFNLQLIERKAVADCGHPWLSGEGCPVIIAIGRLNEAKDFHILISAFAKMRRSRAARLLILGEGELRSSLEALASAIGLTPDDVQMPGFVDNPFAYLSRSALFVLSSRREGLPGALIEAMACGTPVVSTDCRSGPDEILEGGRWGRLVPVGDVDALAKAMTEVLDTPRDQLPDVRARARDFEQERAVDAYLRLLGVQAA